MFKHISVDFWHTLGQPNKEYSLWRNIILGDWYSVKPEVAGLAYKNLKNEWENTAVMCGIVPSLDHLHRQMNTTFETVGGTAITMQRFNQMVGRLQELFIAFPPEVCQPSLEQLRRLNSQGYTLSVGSNTNFIIRGQVISALLPADLFAFQLYSDQLAWCKPHARFFTTAYGLVTRHNPLVNSVEQVLHIGDSNTCDVIAPTNLGLVGQLCTTQRCLHHILQEL